jgi:hypothetical protein
MHGWGVMGERARRTAVLVIAATLVVAGCGGAPDVPSGVRASETVWCADRSGGVDTITWQLHDGEETTVDVKVLELTAGEVTEQDLVDACSRTLRWGASDTLCEAYVDAADLQRFAASESIVAVHGEMEDEERPGFPVVVRGIVDCEDLTPKVDTTTAAIGAIAVPSRMRAWGSTGTFNAWRAEERGWRDAADAGCLGVEEARELALDARERLSGDWPVLDTAHAAEDPVHAGLCFDVRLDRGGFIEVGYHAVESPGGRSGDVRVDQDVSEDDQPDS